MRLRQLQTEEEDGGHRCERSSGLQGEDIERLFGSSWQPFDREEQQYRELPGHEQLPEMGRCSLVRLTNETMPVMENVIHCGDTYHSPSGERHCEGKKGTGMFQDGAKGVGIRVHFASQSWKGTLKDCGADNAAGVRRLLSPV